ncbi:MAG: O-antigen ligase family protein [Rhodospirillales bacterium]|nr:O-antigen ligase family protein [Rhodospirillales bacterium]
MNDGPLTLPEGSARLRAFAILLGCALPIQVVGRGAIGVVVLAAFLCFLSMPGKSLYVKRAFGAARGPIGVMLLITLIFWLPNAFNSVDPVRSLEAAMRTFAFVGIGTLFWAVLIEHRGIQDLSLRALVIASTLSVVIALIAQTALPELHWFLHFRGWISLPLGTSLKPFSALAVLTVPAMILAGIRLKGVWTVLAVANVVGFLALVWLTYNRATIAGLLGIIVLAAGLTAGFNRTRQVKVAMAIATLAVFSAVLIWLNVTRQRHGFGDDWLFPLWLIDFQRQTIWNFAIELFQQNFWFGMGANTINFAPGADAVIPRTFGLAIMPSHPHNWVLEVAAETGIFGLFSLLVAVSLSLMQYARGFFRTGNGAYFSAACMAAGYWASGLFNFSFWSSWWQVSFVLMTGFCLAQCFQPVGADDTQRKIEALE